MLVMKQDYKALHSIGPISCDVCPAVGTNRVYVIGIPLIKQCHLSDPGSMPSLSQHLPFGMWLPLRSMWRLHKGILESLKDLGVRLR